MLKDMIPIFLLPLLGFLSMEQIQKMLMGNNGSNVNNSYSDSVISKWVLDHVKKSEGSRDVAYTANDTEKRKGQWTIGFGTCYLFDSLGKSFNNNWPKKGQNGVAPGDTLFVLKTKMGYSKLIDSDFAIELIKNHLRSSLSSYSYFSKVFTDQNLPYIQRVKDVCQEFSYGSGSIRLYATSCKAFAPFLESLKSRDFSRIASMYCQFRYEYLRRFTTVGGWNDSRKGWMYRTYSVAYYLKYGQDIDSMRTLGYKGTNADYTTLSKAMLKEFGVVVDFSLR